MYIYAFTFSLFSIGFLQFHLELYFSPIFYLNFFSLSVIFSQLILGKSFLYASQSSISPFLSTPYPRSVGVFASILALMGNQRLVINANVAPILNGTLICRHGLLNLVRRTGLFPSLLIFPFSKLNVPRSTVTVNNKCPFCPG